MIGKIVASLITILLWSAGSAAAQGTVKIGLIVPLTGPFSAIGQEIQFGARVFVQHNGTMVAGKTIELIIRDDGGLPDNTFLRNAFGVIRHAAIVSDNQFEGFSRNHRAVMLHKNASAKLNLLPNRGEWPG